MFPAHQRLSIPRGSAGPGSRLEFGFRCAPGFPHSGLATSLKQLLCTAECASARCQAERHKTHLRLLLISPLFTFHWPKPDRRGQTQPPVVREVYSSRGGGGCKGITDLQQNLSQSYSLLQSIKNIPSKVKREICFPGHATEKIPTGTAFVLGVSTIISRNQSWLSRFEKAQN